MMNLIEQVKSMGFVISVVTVATGMNILLSGVHAFLGWLKDKTSNDLDNRLYEITGKVCQALQKVIEWSQGNRPNVPASVAAKPVEDAPVVQDKAA